MEKRIMIWMGIGVLFLFALYFAFQTGISGAGVSAGTDSGKIDTTGWSENEIMNYEMHGVVPARISSGGNGASTGSSGGMVGGC